MKPVIDTGGDEWLTGMPYAGQDSVVDDGSMVSASLERAGESAVELTVPGRGSWRLEHDVVALDRTLRRGPRPWPPPERVVVVSGAAAPGSADTLALDGRSIGELVEAVRDARVVVFSAPDARAAALIVQLSAAGIACAAPIPIAGIGPRLAAALRVNPDELAADDVGWASALAGQSRAVWLDHDLHVLWRRGADGWRPELGTAPLPTVTVVMASRRPDAVPGALRQIAAQQTITPEVVVALHGGGSPESVEAELQSFGLEGRVLSIPAEVPLGGVLDAAVETASGDHIAKWDDDDRYGPHHLEDLVVAARRSRADLIGKRAEFIHFEKSGDTVFRTPKGAERDAGNIAGATLFTGRDVLRSAGGFPPIPRAVDYHLRKRYRDLGLRIHRTHGFGFVLVRGEDHTWEVDDDKLRTRVIRTWEGIPDIAGVG